jgi:uncharacterized protein (TIRG00374 family)
MRKILVNIVQYIFFLGLGFFLLWLTTRNLTSEQVKMMASSLKEAKYLLVIPAMLLLLASHYSRALRWRILMEPLGARPSRTNTFIAVMLGYFFNLLVPRLGEVMKCTLLARYEKVPADKLVGTMVAERAFDVICLLLVIFVTIIIQVDIVGEFASAEFGSRWAVWRAAPIRLIGPLAAIIAGFLFIRYILSRFAHINIISKIRKILRGITEGLTSVRHVKKKTAFFLHSVFIWAMYLLSIRLGFYAMESVSHLGMAPSFTILSFGSLAMILTQGGIGAYQFAVQKTLTLYGIPEVNGLAFGWLLWLVQTIMVLGVGFLCLIFLPWYNRKKNEPETIHTK